MEKFGEGDKWWIVYEQHTTTLESAKFEAYVNRYLRS
jgi:hypothetical protein